MPRLQKSLERPRKAARQPRPKELSEKHRKDEPQSIQPMWRHLIWAAATAAASRRDEPRFAALACHERRPWCVASEPDEDRLLALRLVAFPVFERPSPHQLLGRRGRAALDLTRLTTPFRPERADSSVGLGEVDV